MERQKRADTRPERELRVALHRRGLRYRAHLPIKGTRRTIDIAFPRLRIAVFVDGCFWHGCPTHGTSPKANARWWAEKLAANIERDRDTRNRLEAAGWKVLRVWEHEDRSAAVDRIWRLVCDLRVQGSIDPES